MGFFDKVKDVASNPIVATAVGGPMAGMAAGAIKGAGGLGGLKNSVFGNGQDPGILGTGMFDPQKQDINEKAFNDASGYDARRSEFAAQLAQAQARQGAQINQGASNEVRGRQMTLADQLTAQAAGQGPSLANMQLQQATNRNLAQAAALASSGRGGAQGGLGMRQVQNQQADIAGQAARDAAILRVQEQMQARESLGGLLNQTRGTDVSLATNQAQIQQDQNALNDQQARFYGQGMMDLDQKQREALMALEKLKVDQQVSNEAARANAYAGAAKSRGDLVGGVGAGIAAAFSDKRLKKNIKDGGKAVDDFMKNYAMGGEVEPMAAPKPPAEDGSDTKDESSIDKFLKGWSTAGGTGKANESGQSKIGKVIGSSLGKMMNGGGSESDLEKESKSGSLQEKLGPALKAMGSMSQGGEVSGRAKVAGDSMKNDTVPIKASPGEIVLPRTVAQSGDEKKVMDFLSGIKPEMYNYKNAQHGAGTYVSPMAQDIEKTELGKDMVIDTPEGKMVDYSRAAGTLLAAQSNLHKRLAELEAKKGK